MAFLDYREPIEYVVDRYFERKRFYQQNDGESGVSLSGGEYADETLPDIPCRIFRDEQHRVYKLIYGELDLLTAASEGAPVVWQEELVRDEQGRLVQIITTYPDGETVITALKRGEDGAVSEYGFVAE